MPQNKVSDTITHVTLNTINDIVLRELEKWDGKPHFFSTVIEDWASKLNML